MADTATSIFYANEVTEVANGNTITWNTEEYSLGNNVTLNDFAWSDYYTESVYFTNYLYYSTKQI